MVVFGYHLVTFCPVLHRVSCWPVYLAYLFRTDLVHACNDALLWLTQDREGIVLICQPICGQRSLRCNPRASPYKQLHAEDDILVSACLLIRPLELRCYEPYDDLGESRRRKGEENCKSRTMLPP